MSWPSTDFEVEIQNELDTLRARNEKLEALVRHMSSQCSFAGECTICIFHLESLKIS